MNIAVVTGASSGVGREVAMDLVRRGWQVILPARIKDRVADVVAFAGQIGAPPPLVLVCDLADHVQVRALCDEIAAAFRPNVVVNCAGVGGGVDVSVREVNPRGVELRMAVNAATPHIIARLLAPRIGRRWPHRSGWQHGAGTHRSR